MLASLVALWAFAATVTVREAVSLLSVSTLADDVGKPADALVAELQRERRLSLVYLGGGTKPQQAALVDQRKVTDRVRRVFAERADSAAVKRTATDTLEQRLDECFARLDNLDQVRQVIDSRRLARDSAATLFTEHIDSAFRIYGAIATSDDPEIAKSSRTLVALSRAREVLSQEDALLAGALAGNRRFTASEHTTFVELAGTQRFLYAEASAELSTSDRDEYDRVVTGVAFTRFRGLEDRVVGAPPGTIVPVDAAAWHAATATVIERQRDYALRSADGLIERATPAAIWVLVRLLLAGGLGLIAVIASIVVSITTARSLVRQMEKLRNAARELANERLPRVVDRLRRGEPVDIAVEAPPLSSGSDEIGQVGRAFNDVQETAVRVAVEQAELRQGIRDVFLSLARRSQALLHRQLSLLDAMERKEMPPDELEQLFRVDHLATRMRRNAENLIVLSGAVAGRGWRHPIPIVDVVRGAIAEVEEYERVAVAPVGTSALAGRAVGDVIHLLAELIENALSFSPPHTMVNVSGQLVGNGFAVEIEDRGLGMSAADLEAANAQLEDPPEFNLSSTARLGLYVVGRLAERHKVKVRLRTSAYGGVTAVVLIPISLIVGDAGAAAAGPDLPRDRRTAALAGEGERKDVARSEAEETVAIDRAQVTTLGPRNRAGQRALPAEETPVAAPAPQAHKAPPYGAGRTSQVEVHTSSGLPRRVRQASLASPLRQEPQVDAETVEPDAAPRPPEDVRRMMASYQRGTVRARADADADAEVPEPQTESDSSTGTGQLPGDR